MTPLQIKQKQFKTISMRDFQLRLLTEGIKPAQVSDAIAKVDDPVQKEIMRIHWEKSTTVMRSHPFITQLATVFQLTDSQLDKIFA